MRGRSFGFAQDDIGVGFCRGGFVTLPLGFGEGLGGSQTGPLRGRGTCATGSAVGAGA